MSSGWVSPEASLLGLQTGASPRVSCAFSLRVPPGVSSSSSKDTSHGGSGSILKSVKVLVSESCPTLCNRVDYSLPGSSVRGILQEGILEWVAMSFYREGLPDPGIKAGVLHWQADSLPLSHLGSPILA